MLFCLLVECLFLITDLNSNWHCHRYLRWFLSPHLSHESAFKCVRSLERESAAFSCPFCREVKVQSHAHNSTTGGDNFSALSGADDANTGLEHSPLCHTTVHCGAWLYGLCCRSTIVRCFTLTNVKCSVVTTVYCTLLVITTQSCAITQAVLLKVWSS